MPFGLQPIHLVVILIVALLVFGPRQLPRLGRWIARTFAELRKGTRDMAEGFRQEMASNEHAGTPPGGAAASPEPAGKFCRSLRASNVADARFCNKCGAAMRP